MASLLLGARSIRVALQPCVRATREGRSAGAGGLRCYTARHSDLQACRARWGNCRLVPSPRPGASLCGARMGGGVPWRAAEAWAWRAGEGRGRGFGSRGMSAKGRGTIRRSPGRWTGSCPAHPPSTCPSRFCAGAGTAACPFRACATLERREPGHHRRELCRRSRIGTVRRDSFAEIVTGVTPLHPSLASRASPSRLHWPHSALCKLEGPARTLRHRGRSAEFSAPGVETPARIDAPGGRDPEGR